MTRSNGSLVTRNATPHALAGSRNRVAQFPAALRQRQRTAGNKADLQPRPLTAHWFLEGSAVLCALYVVLVFVQTGTVRRLPYNKVVYNDVDHFLTCWFALGWVLLLAFARREKYAWVCAMVLAAAYFGLVPLSNPHRIVLDLAVAYLLFYPISVFNGAVRALLMGACADGRDMWDSLLERYCFVFMCACCFLLIWR